MSSASSGLPCEIMLIVSSASKLSEDPLAAIDGNGLLADHRLPGLANEIAGNLCSTSSTRDDVDVETDLALAGSPEVAGNPEVAG